eukprot:15170566-Alexandrium_andersonii.AAC.1
MGSRKGWFGPSARPYFIFLYERAAVQEDLLIMECTPDFDTVPMVTALQEHYRISLLRLIPPMFGFPAARD